MNQTNLNVRMLIKPFVVPKSTSVSSRSPTMQMRDLPRGMHHPHGTYIAMVNTIQESAKTAYWSRINSLPIERNTIYRSTARPRLNQSTRVQFVCASVTK